MNLEERVREILEGNPYDDTRVDQILQAFREHVDEVVVKNPYHKPNWFVTLTPEPYKSFEDGKRATKDAIKEGL